MSNVNQIITGLQILKKYPGYDKHVEPDHDVIYSGGEKVSPWYLAHEDIERLNHLGWYWEDGIHTWRFYT